MVEAKAGGTVDVGRLERAVDGAEILIGFPDGIRHPGSDVDNSQIAEWLHDGTATIPSRPFLIEGIASDIETINKAIKEAFEALLHDGKLGARKIGALAVGAVQRFVRGDYYRTHTPNAPATIARKSKGKKIGDTPLIDTGFLINSTTYVVKGGKR